MKKCILIIAIAIIVIACGFGIFFLTQNKASKPSLEFNTGACDNTIGDPYAEPKYGIISKDWLDDNTLKVEGFLKTNCSGVTIVGNFIVGTDKNLYLTFNESESGPLVECLCNHKLDYKISNIKKGDFSVILTPVNLLGI